VVYGPYFNTVIYPVYSQDAAYLALQNKEVDIVLNPSGVSSGVRDQLSGDPNIELVKNAQNGFRYIEFNQAKPYFKGDAGMALRQAVACQIDLDFLANNVLQRQVEPVYTLVPPGLTYWHNKDVPIYCQGKTPQERIEESVKILKAAGFTWEKEPSFSTGDSRTAGVVYGVGIKMPDGTKIPDITMQAPGPGYDPLRATSGVYIEQWMRQLGIPVTTVYTPFNTIRANENSGAFDIIMLGWGLTAFPSYLCDFFTGATGAGDGSDNISYVSPKLHEKCGEFYAANKLEDARAIAFDLQNILATELPYITLFTNPIYDAYQSSIAYPYTKVFDGIQGIYGAANLVMPNVQQ
jgi:peptide/nickel transport system substrate-binding protein